MGCRGVRGVVGILLLSSCLLPTISHADIRVIDSPKAATLGHGEMRWEIGVANEGAVLTSIKVGAFERMYFGLSYGMENVLGRGEVDSNPHPGIQLQVLAYDEESAGGMMNVDVVTVRPDVTLEVVSRYLRAVGDIPDGTDSIFVVSRDNTYIGSLFLSRLLTHDPEEMVASVMSTDLMPIPAHTPSNQVVWEFENRDLLSAPVIDDDYRVLGRITVDDVVDVIRDEAEHALMGAVGLDEEDDMFAPVFKSATRRALWLGVNLGTAFLAAAVVDQFKTTLDAIVLLAVLMPIVPSMGGVAGTQSLVIITRAIALGQINTANAAGILRKELLVGVLNGLGWALIVSLFTYLWFGDWRIGGIIGAAMIINLVVAASAGFFIPLTLKRLKVDPALAGGVVLTTVTDVVGYMSFLGLAAFFLM